jgi:MOSC domain-containing protein YiiM
MTKRPNPLDRFARDISTGTLTWIGLRTQRRGEIAGHDHIDPGALRRNLVVRGINLNALRHQRFQIGDALFEATALCHPCSRMETALGKGGVAAMLGHGGLCARILKTGVIRVGDQVEVRPEGENLQLF